MIKPIYTLFAIFFLSEEGFRNQICILQVGDHVKYHAMAYIMKFDQIDCIVNLNNLPPAYIIILSFLVGR